MKKYDKKFWDKYDATPETFATATKQPWECQTYAEFLASCDDADDDCNDDD
jgi:hypothetical protein